MICTGLFVSITQGAMARTYYEILGVAENASEADIEAAFRAKAREVHPDTVPAENTYLRKVAAEAFKDLSEAKAVLLDPDRRQKYDAGLVYARSTEQAHAEPSGQPSSQSSGQSRTSSQSRTSGRSQRNTRSRTNASGVEAVAEAARRARQSISHFPDIKNLNSFLFMILGIGTIFFLALLVWDDRTPPLWLAVITACLGILSFMNGMRPKPSTITSGRTALILSAILVAGVLFSLWVLSPSYLEIAIAHKAEAAASKFYKRKKAPQPTPTTASPATAKPPTVAVVDESEEDEALPTKIWSNLKDGQNYRTRLDGELLSLEAIQSGGKIAGEITKCEFHRTAGGAPNWVGICSEQDLHGDGERDSMATLRPVFRYAPGRKHRGHSRVRDDARGYGAGGSHAGDRYATGHATSCPAGWSAGRGRGYRGARFVWAAEGRSGVDPGDVRFGHAEPRDGQIQ